MGAGLVDSLVLSMAWTVVVLRVAGTHGLVGAGLVSTALLIGVALSAPFAGWLSRRLDGRRLLRVAAGVEALLRLSVFAALYLVAPLSVLVVCVVAMNVVAWTGYAGMRAEVAAVSTGAAAITWYATIVASVEAVGVALAALLPVSGDDVAGWLWVTMTAVYVLGLLPTVVVAGGSAVPRAAQPLRAARTRWQVPARPSMPVAMGTGLMLVASAPPLLAVALAAQLHGRTAVGLAAIAFTVGSLLSPVLAGRLQAAGRNGPVTWSLLAAGMVAGWTLAPVSITWLCVAQLASGLSMTALEGLVDSYAAERRPHAVTATLAQTTAGRALGSAAGAAAFPAVVLLVGLSQAAVTLTAVLLLVAVIAAALPARSRRAPTLR